MLVVGAGIVLAGTPARGIVVPASAEILARAPAPVDPSDAAGDHRRPGRRWSSIRAAETGIQQVVVTLGQNLELENQALLRRDADALDRDRPRRPADRDAGPAAQAIATGTTVITHYQFDTIDVSLLVPFGRQVGLSLGFAGRGTQIQLTYDANGTLVSQVSSPFADTFAVRRATGGRWLNVAVLPAS